MGRQSHKWEENTKKDLRKIGLKGAGWTGADNRLL
jgi:hypothetical protein